jgi:hypothetical protein
MRRLGNRDLLFPLNDARVRAAATAGLLVAVPVVVVLSVPSSLLRRFVPSMRGVVVPVKATPDPRSEGVLFRSELVDEVTGVTPEGEVGAYV